MKPHSIIMQSLYDALQRSGDPWYNEMYFEGDDKDRIRACVSVPATDERIFRIAEGKLIITDVFDDVGYEPEVHAFELCNPKFFAEVSEFLGIIWGQSDDLGTA